MKFEPVTIGDYIELLFMLGSKTFLTGIIFQVYFIYRQKIKFVFSFFLIMISQLVTIAISMLIWRLRIFPLETVFCFIFSPAIIPEFVTVVLTYRLTKNYKKAIISP